MSALSATHSDALSAASCARELPAARGEGDAPEWVHLLPVGEVKGRDGRAWTLDDPDALIAAFNGNGADLPVDFEHQAERPATGPVPAAGWIKALALTASGIWGRIEWTARARELIGAKEYRYISPTFLHLKDGRIVRLKGAGLVHHPNLHLTALAAQEDSMTATATEQTKPMDFAAFASRLTQMLGLPPDVDAEALMGAIEKLVANPDPAKFVPAAAVQDMLRETNLKLAMQMESEAEAKVADAMSRGYLTGALKPWATALCRSDPAAFDEFIAKSAPPYAHLLQRSMNGQPPSSKELVDTSSEAMAICRQLGLKPEDLKS